MPFRFLSKDALIHGEIWQEYNTLSMSNPTLHEHSPHTSDALRQVSVFKAAPAAVIGLQLPAGKPWKVAPPIRAVV
jgi:hypothetical protein